MNFTQVIDHKLETSCPSNGVPIVFVVEADFSIRDSLRLLIQCGGWQAETFASASKFLAAPRTANPCCLVLNVCIPDGNGLELQKRLAAERPSMPIIFITDEPDVYTSVRAMKGGAVDFLIQPFGGEILLGAIREGMRRSCIELSREAEVWELRNSYASLSRRERQVMALVASGLLNKQAGAELGISEITVKAHRGQVMQKMKADSFADLVRMAASLFSEPAFLRSSDLRLTSPSPAVATPTRMRAIFPPLSAVRR